MRSTARKLWSALKVVLILLAAWAIIGAGIVAFIEVKCHAPTYLAGEKQPARTPRVPAVTTFAAQHPEYARPEDDTYLSYPEWYIVWSYEEKAHYQALHLPSGFPFYGAIGQYWSSYCGVNRLVQGRYPFNVGDHLMLVVIGTSFTVEYALKGLYEKTIGRVTELLSGHQQVEEDRYAYLVAQQYADFTTVRPFYEYSFVKALAGLWRSTPFWGRHPLRKLERRGFLTFDYGVEALYCELIQLATQALYGVAGRETYAWIDRVPAIAFRENPHVRTVQSLGADGHIVIIPRYQEFTPTALRLCRRGAGFREIAGNAGEIAVSALAPQLAQYDLFGAEQVYSSVLLTSPGWKRILIRIPVQALELVLPRLAAQRVSVEHLYDY